LVLSWCFQTRARLAVQGQGPHHLAVRLLAVGVQRRLARGGQVGLLVLFAPRVGLGQPIQGLHELVERCLPLQEQPLLELRRIGQRQPGEQFAPVERRGLDQAREAPIAGSSWPWACAATASSRERKVTASTAHAVASRATA